MPDTAGPGPVSLAFPSLARMENPAPPGPTEHRPSMAACRISALLAMEKPTWKSRPRTPCRKALTPDTIRLIRGMSRANPLWGAPRKVQDSGASGDLVFHTTNNGAFQYSLFLGKDGKFAVGTFSPTYDFHIAKASLFLGASGGSVGFLGKTPAARQSISTADIAFTCPAPSTPDYSFAATSGGYGFSSADEFNSCLAVIAALQSRINQIVSALQAYGLLA